MIVETITNNGCTCHISDDAYRDKTPEEVSRIVRNFSDFIVGEIKGLKGENRLGGRKEDKPMRVRDWIVVGLLMNGLPIAMFLHWLLIGY